MTTAHDLIARHGLRPHPEGGHFVETFRSQLSIAAHGGVRSASTAILFLLDGGEVSRWHRVRSDEVWHWYEGCQLELLTCERVGAAIVRHRLGPSMPEVSPQVVVAAGWWQAARPLTIHAACSHALVGCTVAPGFAFEDFELIDPQGQDAAWFRKMADARWVDG